MKIRFLERIKEVEGRLGDTEVILNSFILSWTPYPQLNWGISRKDLEKIHVLFMTDHRDHYIDKLFTMVRGEKNELQRKISSSVSFFFGMVLSCTITGTEL